MLALELPWICGEVTYYPYRRFTVTNRIIECERATYREPETELMDITNRAFSGNHEVYGIRFEHGHSLYVLFSDEHAIFGLSIREGIW